MKAGYKKMPVKDLVQKAYQTDMPKRQPTVSLDETALPAIKNWKVGGKYKLVLEVEQTSLSKDTFDNENEMRANFKILNVKEAK